MTNTRNLVSLVRSSFILLLISTVCLGGVYPALIEVFAKIIPHNSEQLIGKNFTEAKNWFLPV